ncbi:WD repeat-containing and planar cell polarity effector protein fritz homolog isoform X2 [Anthonomus grandis grandis]|uniref:WD repeat-containing and planar cell polarity effector protein fritz homolog isoform X2 n=1 Tax=Anthonomus grandis grandis TaxID=2921223 RepID=UPI00216632AF|nr:WD repeat-containing and planar cell polarity effector protein fritz homolog isoform X2 [Anthonomus grandis grandis]
MAAFLSDIHFWTTQEDVLIKDTDYGSFKYYHKKESNLTQTAQAKKVFCEQVGITYTPVNKRPDRLRDRLKELEEHLIHNKIVYYCWDESNLKILLSTGLIVCLTINQKTGDLVNITFDKQLFLKLQVNIICDGAVSVEVSNFELISNTLKRISVTSVPLQTQVSCTALSEDEERLLIGCIEGSLAILDRNRGSTRIVKAAFIATLAAWHPLGVVLAVGNERGHIQYFDTALNSIKTHLTTEDSTPGNVFDLSGYFNTQFNVVSMNWGPKDLVISFEQGPLALLTHIEGSLTFKSVARLYIRNGKIDHAVRLLLSWDFGEKVFFVLQQITMHLLRCPLTEEVAQFLQEALGSFHNPPIPLSSQIRHKFGHQVVCITRRFFYRLVRASMFETAFLLAVDVGHHDLFMDLHYIAVKLGETEMAAAARAQASALLSRCSSEASNCSRSLCSQCSGSETCSSPTNYEDNVTSGRPRIDLPPENVLATDFMQMHPTTYKPEENEPVKSVDVSRKPFPLRATYVKAPQVPSDFIKQTQQPPPVPQLPFQRALGVSYIQKYVENVANRTKTATASGSIPANQDMDHNVSGLPQYSSPFNNLFNANAKPGYMPLSTESPPPLPRISPSSKLSKSCQNLNGTDIPPPTAFMNASVDNLIDLDDPIAASKTKKAQTKVKFSDTVTAFIVPEVKRPVKPPLPSHIMDPRRELAESLPLCHPNEDYLKDFAPIRKEDDGESPSEPPSAPPKIKVVHFGVV